MARTKKLSQTQVAVLARLVQSEADYYDLLKVGAGGTTASSLVQLGLATARNEGGGQTWTITDAGRAAAQSGRVAVAEQ